MTTFLVIAGFIVLSLAALYLGHRFGVSRGRAEGERDQSKATAEKANEARRIEDDVARMSERDLDDELRSDRNR